MNSNDRMRAHVMRPPIRASQACGTCVQIQSVDTSWVLTKILLIEVVSNNNNNI